jgi:hypothetical protein
METGVPGGLRPGNRAHWRISGPCLRGDVERGLCGRHPGHGRAAGREVRLLPVQGAQRESSRYASRPIRCAASKRPGCCGRTAGSGPATAKSTSPRGTCPRSSTVPCTRWVTTPTPPTSSPPTTFTQWHVATMEWSRLLPCDLEAVRERVAGRRNEPR